MGERRVVVVPRVLLWGECDFCCTRAHLSRVAFGITRNALCPLCRDWYAMRLVALERVQGDDDA